MIDKINFTARVGFYSAPHKLPKPLVTRVDNISRLFEEKTKDSDGRFFVEVNRDKKDDVFELFNSDYKVKLATYVAPFSSNLAQMSDKEASDELVNIFNAMKTHAIGESEE